MICTRHLKLTTEPLLKEVAFDLIWFIQNPHTYYLGLPGFVDKASQHIAIRDCCYIIESLVIKPRHLAP